MGFGKNIYPVFGKRGLIVFFSGALGFFCPALRAQEIQYIPASLPLDTQYCRLQFYSSKPAKKLLELFERTSERRTVIYHYGASHIQAEVLTTEAREQLQSRFGNGGRGLIFNYGAANTYSSVNYSSTAKGKWLYGKSFIIPPKVPLGVMGMAVETKDPEAELNWRFHKPIPADNYDLFILTENNELTPDFELWIDTVRYIFDKSMRRDFNGKNYFHLNLTRSISEIRIKCIASPDVPFLFRFYGLDIETGRKGGLVYHSLGVGAAPFQSVLYLEKMPEQSQLLKPDVVILDFGTNNILYKNKVEPKLASIIEKAIERFRAVNPDMVVVLTTTQDLFYKGKYITAGVQFRNLVDSLAKKNDCLFWNWYDLSGGFGQIKKWADDGYATRDYIHLTQRGYKLKGYLFYRSFMNTLAQVKNNQELALYSLPLKEYSDAAVYTAEKQKEKGRTGRKGASAYTVKSGDTLSHIARKFRVSVAKIKKWNGLKSDFIRAGQILKIR
jgi:LysM repeat protein